MYIRKVCVEHFGPIENVTLRLTPFHALIGPNDGGKSMILKAIETAICFAQRNFDLSYELLQAGTNIALTFDDGLSYELKQNSPSVKRFGIQETWSAEPHIILARLRENPPAFPVRIGEGVHPSHLAKYVNWLREHAFRQMLFETHKPLIVNELGGEEVTVVTRGEHGTKAVRLCDTPNFEERRKVYALGELWLSFCDGIDEAPLLKGHDRQ